MVMWPSLVIERYIIKYCLGHHKSKDNTLRPGHNLINQLPTPCLPIFKTFDKAAKCSENQLSSRNSHHKLVIEIQKIVKINSLELGISGSVKSWRGKKPTQLPVHHTQDRS